ncbi:cytochrome c biogenesis CcdA family protein [Kineococcus rubinsiae]|uniref:cytochrome c biogenesis CcdA family protein n=1 Tax=Kineococcus rubinsiae TaxID=2609562 RepID=UPI001FCB347B
MATGSLAASSLAASSLATGSVVTGSLLLALPVVALAGLLSFLSPCVLPLAPAYLAYVTGLSSQEVSHPHRGRMTLGATLFVLGFASVFVLIGAAVGGAATFLLQYQRPITRVLGVLVILLGISFTGLLPSWQREARIRWRPPTGLAGAPLLGVTFGLGWTPCIGPTLAAVQALTFTESGAGRGALLTGVYALGLGVPFVVLALAFKRFSGALDLVRRHRRAVSIAGGGVLVVIGVLLVSGVWAKITPVMQGWAANFQTVL